MSASYPLVRNRSARSTRTGVRASPSRSGFSPSSISRRLIRSCTLVFYIAAFAAHVFARQGVSTSSQSGNGDLSAVAQSADLSAVAQSAKADPDALYRDRENLVSARQAADIWSARLAANPRDFDSAWKLSRAEYWLGTQGPMEVRRAALERGTDIGKQASQLDPSRPEGYFWMAANMGALAESAG